MIYMCKNFNEKTADNFSTDHLLTFEWTKKYLEYPDKLIKSN